MTNKRYKNPPLIEVLCEFHFEQDTPWDLAIPGIIYDRVKKTFPKRRQAMRVTLGLPSVAAEPQLGAIPLTQFWSEDEKSVIQVGTYLLSVNRLKPYISWEAFLPLIKESFDAYCEVASPHSIRSIALRYINRIEFENQTINLDNYFEFRPYIGPKLPRLHGPFTVAVQLPYENSRDLLNLQLSSIVGAPSPNHLSINLDLTYTLINTEAVALDGAFEWIEIAHFHIGEVFRASITEQLKQRLGEGLES